MPTAAAAFVLIAITYGGTVSSSRYDSLYLCHEARSVYLQGETLKQVAEASEKSKKEEVAAEAAWRLAHPPRLPTNEEEEGAVVGRPGPHWGDDDFGRFSVTADGMIQDEPLISVQMGQTHMITPGEPKSAYCVAEVPGDPLPEAMASPTP